MKKLSLNLDGIKEYQQNREPYLMIDFATEVIPGESSKGYKLLKKPSEIKLAELMRMMDGPIALLPCVSLNYYAPCEECDEKSCKIKPVFEQVRDQTLSILGNTTIDLMRHKHLIAVKE